MRLASCFVIAFLGGVAPTVHAAGELKPWSGGDTPALELKDLSGATHRLEDYRGKVLLVNFWATWCAPCREEMPSIGRLKKQLDGRPFVVLAVNVDEPESRVKNFLAKLPLDFPTLLDPGGHAAKAWKARILPATFLIGPSGRIHYAVTGELDWASEPVVRTVSELLPVRKQ